MMFGRYETLHRLDRMLLASALLFSVLMVSNIRYPGFKKIPLKKTMLTKTLVLPIAAAPLLCLFPVEWFALIVTLYILRGILRAAYMLAVERGTIRKKKFIN